MKTVNVKKEKKKKRKKKEKKKKPETLTGIHFQHTTPLAASVNFTKYCRQQEINCSCDYVMIGGATHKG